MYKLDNVHEQIESYVADVVRGSAPRVTINPQTSRGFLLLLLLFWRWGFPNPARVGGLEGFPCMVD